MRRTLTVLVAAAAFLVPAGAASAGQGVPNASCNNGKGGNYSWTGHTDSGKGSGKYSCVPVVKGPVEQAPPEEPAPVIEDK